MGAEAGDHELDVGRLIEDAASSWAGPSPHAGQARWTRASRRSRPGALGLALAGTAVIVVGLGSGLVAAAAVSPGGTASSVMHLVSHLPGRTDVTPPPIPVTPTPAAGAATPGASPAAPAAGRPAAAPRSRPGATPAGWRDDPTAGRSPAPSPRPSPSPGTSPSPGPSPNPGTNPTPPPDE